MGCSLMQSAPANDSSMLVSPPRRQSLRVKAINAIYEAENSISSSLQQTSGEGSLCSNDMEVDSANAPDDSTMNVTLKDLRKRCKSRKRKALEPVGSSTSDIDHALVEPKEEEPDLDEPIICLKLKSSNRKKSKHSHLSESILLVDETTAPVPKRPTIGKEAITEDESTNIPGSVDENLQVTMDKAPLQVGGPDLVYIVKSEAIEACDDISSKLISTDGCNALGGSSTGDSQMICEKESADDESRSSTCHVKTTSCYSFPPAAAQMGASLLANSPQYPNRAKDEVAESDSLRSENVNDVSVSSGLDLVRKQEDPGNSSDELHELSDRGELKYGDLTSHTPETLICHVNEVSFEFTEADNYIDLQERSDEHLDCCGSEVSTEYVETDMYTCLHESSEDCDGEKSSEKSFHKLLPSFSESEVLKVCTENSQLVSATSDLSLDVSYGERLFNVTSEEIMHENVASQIDNISITESQGCVSENNSIGSRKEFHNQADYIPFPEMPTCINGSNMTAGGSFVRRNTHYMHLASGFSEEVGSLDSLVFKAICGDARRNNIGDHTNSSFEEKYDLRDPCYGSMSCSSSRDSHAGEILGRCTESAGNSAEVDTEQPTNPPSGKSFAEGCNPHIPECLHASCASAGDLHAANEITPNTESLDSSKLDQLLCSHSEDAEELVKAVDCHSPQVSLPDVGTLNGLFNVPDNSSDTSNKVLFSPEETASTAMHNCASEVPNPFDGEGSNVEFELKCNQGTKTEHPPKKLLSNRKDLSPICQEKLRWALNGNNLDDTMKSPNHEEAAVVLRSEKMTRRLKNSRSGTPPSLSKGIIKPQDAFDGNCSRSKISLVHTQAEKAVTFTQRQMQDIENIATKLLKGLTKMRNIVVQTMGSESCPSALSSFTPEEIKMAIDDVSNLETTTKKWLSIMAKDCNRFCRIMNATENKEATSPGIRKQPKRITFADEAGGALCDVKVFDQPPASPLVRR